MSVLEAARSLREAADGFEPRHRVTHAYSPLRYAWEPHRKYVERYGAGGRRVVLVGLNPGPWGMGQTGVPFGDPTTTREWLGIVGDVHPPRNTHPKRPVTGFATTRRDGSGTNLWNWARAHYGSPEGFFETFYVTNYCPLLFFDERGRNLTPPQLRQEDTRALYEACDAHLAHVARALQPEFLVGLGRFAQERAQAVAEREGLDVDVRGVIHPSPAHPANNFGWKPDFSFL